ncbi:VOC family protein [Streptomyces catenulae]|uniref:VOC family protein n=1 Tax=Streptomyces catenulae TaxID=66875 RepID=A0ABV2YZJ0_9ACTN|nr:VOC family protein [Streptomyces catenulae]
MVTRDTPWPEGTPCWVDLAVDDIDRAVAFYGGLLGWNVQRGGAEVGGYSLVVHEGANVAGIGPKMSPGVPTAWTTYLATEDTDRTAARITAAGGTVVVAPMDVMTLGRMAVAADPAGGVFGLWKAGDHTGFGIANEHGTVVWNENMSRDYAHNREFYGSVFGYRYGDIDDGMIKYATLDLPHGTVGGIGELPASLPQEIPAHWMTYFSTPDIDADVARVPGLGGTVAQPPFDTPHGRMAVVADDQGAVFSLITPPPTD